LAVIVLIAILLITHFYVFLPGVLGAVTLYILSRKSYFKLIDEKKWRPGWTALLYLLFYIIIICLPVYFAFILVGPKLTAVFEDPDKVMAVLKTFSHKIQQSIGFEPFTNENVKSITQKLGSSVPKILSFSANLITNLLLMFFVLYYMLIHGKNLEAFLNNIIPLKKKNLSMLATETRIMIKANAIGIPVLAIIQGLVGLLGYWIFGIEEFALWGFITGVCSIIPIVGTGLIWVPLTLYLFSIGKTGEGTGLGIYSLIVLTNIDYVARITVLKKIGDVHPLITILGVIVGLSMFGFLGLIFGPLLISYFILLVKIYRNEFNATQITPLHTEEIEK
ncbi:MAG TPA: AI-2E family transporter, partial [Chitinophagaceae bacterium]|nr:AI-2E family transporter [Chitinophagaceae bacterium]